MSDGCPLVYLERDTLGEVHLTKPVVVETTFARIGFLTGTFEGSDHRRELFGWLNERRMTVEYGNPWDERARQTLFMRPDGRPTRSSRHLSLRWVFGFDTEDQAIEFKLRWL